MTTLAPQELDEIAQSPYKKDFPLLANNPDLAFLDSAATAQRPAAVLDAQRDFYETMNANPLRGLYRLSVEATKAIDDARAAIAGFLGAKDANEVVFTRNASESLNIAASCLGRLLLAEGDEVVISIMEHHSNLIPWQRICEQTGAKLVYMRCDREGSISDDEIRGKIGPKAKIVSVTQVSNVLGVETPVQKIASRAHEMGAAVVVDGAQSAPHVEVDVASLGCDLFAFSAHKLGGPMGVGVLWGKMDLLQRMPVFLTGGEMIDSVTEQAAVWAPVPQKFEAGTQDAAGIYATGAAIAHMQACGIEAIERRERLLAAYLCEQLQALSYVNVFGPLAPSEHVGSVAFNVCMVHPHDVASLLDSCDVAIRAGHHCAQPLLAYMGIQSCCRASIAYYNDKADIDKLIGGLAKVQEIFHGICD